MPFALPIVKETIFAMGGKPVVREGKGKLGPTITDNGNAVIDAYFGEVVNPAELDVKVKMVPGLVESGFFIGLTDVAYIGTSSTAERIQKPRKSTRSF